MPAKPTEELAAGRAFYAQALPELDVSYFAAMWHIFNVGHLVAADLDRIAHKQDLSIADLHLLGTLRIDRPSPLRATDLALTLNVSNAVLTARIQRLARAGLLLRTASPSDKRAFDLTLTAEGAAIVDAAIVEISREAKMVRHLANMSEPDREALARILGDLHERMDRDFVAVTRGGA